MLACSYSSRCSGCDWLLVPASEQRQRKTTDLRSHVSDFFAADLLDRLEFIEVTDARQRLGGLRDRVDLLLDRMPHNGSSSARLGLFDRFKTGVVDLEGCPQLSPALESWLGDFRRLKILGTDPAASVRRGSVRLRVAPDGRRGVWLDFANVDVKRLLDEDSALRELLANAVVEIGQRRKRLFEREDGQLKLADPVLEPWFETYGEDNAVFPLYCTIGSFTQPGFRANRALVSSAMAAVRASGARHAIEFGSGIGNFTLPLALACESVDAYEVDGLALAGLKRAAEAAGVSERVRIHEGNFQIERKQGIEFDGAELVFVDPPRSGLIKFLEPLAALEPARRPRHFIYVSCFAGSFAEDARRLTGLGYEARNLAIIDQFPQSRHYEIVAAFAARF